MRVSIVGAGPAGTTAALLLARQGHHITLVDRDPGPRPGEGWERVGVMQFHLPQTLRAPGRNLLARRLPDLHQALMDAGAVVAAPPGGPEYAANLYVRREVMERAMWEFTSREPGISRVRGHADGVVLDDDRVTGVVVSTRSTRQTIGADLVVDASGRAGRFAAAYRAQVDGGDCGVAYASRLFQLRPGADPGPMNGGPGWMAEYDGLLNIIFVHDAGTFSVLLARLGSDRELTALRDETAYTTALSLLPAAAEWTDPARAFPIDKVRAGAGLVNLYRPQTREVTGLLAIGDAVCTTNPTGGRGVTLAMRAAAELADLVATHPHPQWAARLDAWSLEQLRPWFEEHLIFDRAMRARWSRQPLDPNADISWDLVAAAATQRPDFMPALAPFLAMLALPHTIDPLRDQVRAMLRNGWRPPTPPGPTRDDLVAAISGSLSTVVS
ncbi:MAG TPA: NAD(P)/FAD-dependent oxidoreductase [Jiangellaceae bacterium]|nr:NAD(P)/FAD-dependent oxidoreductase [Jiangellaceae bacterium]